MTANMPLEDVFANISVFLLFAWFCSSVMEIRKPLLSIGLGTVLYGWLLPLLSIHPVWVNNVPPTVRYIVTMILFWLYVRVSFKAKFAEKLIAYFLGYSLISISQVLTTVLMGLIGFSVEEHMEWVLGISTAMAFAFMFLVSRAWRSISLIVNQKRFWTFLLIPACQFALIMLTVYFMSKTSDVNLFMQASRHRWIMAAIGVAFLLSLVADGLVMDSIGRMENTIREKERLNTLELENKLTYEYIKAVESDISEMRRYRHDFLNMLTAVQLTIENGAEDHDREALCLIREMTNELGGITGKHYCECNIINCILALEESRMRKCGIECELCAEVPEVLGVSELDLCRVLTNLLDNAREYCQRMPETEHRWVRSNLRLQDGYLYVTVCNSYSGEELSFGSSKKDRKNHGLGIDILRDITKKHGGELIFSPKEDSVEVIATFLWVQPEETGKTGTECEK